MYVAKLVNYAVSQGPQRPPPNERVDRPIALVERDATLTIAALEEALQRPSQWDHWLYEGREEG